MTIDVAFELFIPFPRIRCGPSVREVGFELHAGERVGLVGPNGVGKTTLMRILAGLDTPDTGEVRLHAGARVALLRQQPDFAPAARFSPKPVRP